MKSIIALAVAGTMLSAPVVAEEAIAQEKDPFTLGAHTSMLSDYRIRGASVSNEDAVLQQGFSITHDSGIYVSTFASSQGTADQLELNYIAGWSGHSDGWGLDVNGTWYSDIGNGASSTDDWWGVSADAQLHMLTLTSSFSPDQDASGDYMVYAGVGVKVPFGPLEAHGGAGREFNEVSGSDAFDWSAGVSVPVTKLVSLSADWVDNDVDNNEGAFILGVHASL